MRGRLTIFLGYAAGVGKTYSMLKAAQNDRACGVDVVCGYIEAHGRMETDKLLEGLEVIPPIRLEKDGVSVVEFDLNRAIRRRPQVILVDELAHTNASMCRNNRRYQDIFELLDLGIDVYTTLNVQHIESLNTRVYEYTGVVVRETIPDFVFDKADYIKVVDIEPSELIERIKGGFVYKRERVKAALDGFFTIERLEALREIALRKSADKLSLKDRVRREIVLVCLSASPSNPRVLREAKKLSDAFHGTLHALYVDIGQNDDPNVLLKHRALASDLGCILGTVYGDNIYDEIVHYAKKIRASKIVIGKTVTENRFRLNYKDIVDELNMRLSDIDIYVIPNHIKRSSRVVRPEVRFKSVISAIILLSLTTLLGYVFYVSGVDDSQILLLYVLSSLVYALTNVRIVGTLIYTLLGILLFNFFFTEPRFTFYINDKSIPITLVIVFVISAMMNYVNIRVRKEAKRSRLSNRRLSYLLEARRRLEGVGSRDIVINEFIRIIKETLGVDCVFYSYSNELYLSHYKEEWNFNTSHELALASISYMRHVNTGRYSNNLAGSMNSYYPVLASGDVICGVVGVYDSKVLTPFLFSVFKSYLEILAGKLMELEYQRNMSEAQIKISNEELKTTFLRSVSHDLKTPLMGIRGNCELLLTSRLDEGQKNYVSEIHKETIWLSDMVNNILSITRFKDSSEVMVEPNLISDIISEALGHVSAEIERRNVVFKDEADVVVMCESRLLVQAFINVINNAIEHTAEGSNIWISYYCLDKTVYVRISNDGEKIDSDERIFDLFYTTKKNDQRRGSGLGLYITRNIMRLHKGDVRVVGDERLTIFELFLPIFER